MRLLLLSLNQISETLYVKSELSEDILRDPRPLRGHPLAGGGMSLPYTLPTIQEVKL